MFSFPEKLPEIIRQLPEMVKKIPHFRLIARVVGKLAQKVFGYSSGIYVWVNPYTYLFSAVQIPISGYYFYQSLVKIGPLRLHLDTCYQLCTTFGCIGVLGNHGLHFIQGFALSSHRAATVFESMSCMGHLTAHTLELSLKPKKIQRTRLEIAAILLDLASKAIFVWTPYRTSGSVVYGISTLVSFSKYLV